MRIIERIGSKNTELGHFLLNDEDGSIMETIVDNTRGNNEAVNREMFRRWLAGSGVQPVTWHDGRSSWKLYRKIQVKGTC